jgi:hypothetical protein
VGPHILKTDETVLHDFALAPRRGGTRGCRMCGALFAQPAASSGGSGDSAELAKKLSNPISDLVSVPFQFNWEQNVGPRDQTRFNLNVQPVMPFSLTPKMNLITRVIVPFVSQPPLADGGVPAAGVGDILASFLLSPNTGSTFTRGVGPVISLPSTVEPTLGTEKWSAGPTIVALKQAGPWTVGPSGIKSGRSPATPTSPT